ncbi:MAG TPA: hypothetical protein VIU64_04535 [Polyangia bacterium]
MSDSNDTQAATVERRSSQLLGPALSIVDAGPISALAFLVGLVAGLFFGSPLPVMIAMAAALLAVALRLSSPRVWRLADEYEATKKIDLPPDTTLSDPAAKAQLARIVAARTELDEVLSAGPTDRREVRRRLRAVRDLERAAVAALRRLEFFAHAPCDGHGRAPTLEERDAGAVPAAGQLLGRAAAARAERQEALEALGAHRLQQLARLEYLTCCLEAIPAELMELRAMEAEMVDRCRPDPVREADQLRDELQHLRREMASLLVSETKPVDRGQDDGADHRPHA